MIADKSFAEVLGATVRAHARLRAKAHTLDAFLCMAEAIEAAAVGDGARVVDRSLRGSAHAVKARLLSTVAGGAP